MVWKSVLLLIAAFVVASPALAQNYPLPTKVGQPAAICTGCSGNNFAGEPNSGKPTYQYAAPLSKFVGRLVDSNDTLSVQHIGMRTARAGMVRTALNQRGSAPPRIYSAIGQTLGVYSLSTFFSQRLPGGLVSLGAVDVGGKVGGRTPLEKITPWDAYVYPESPRSGGWSVPIADNQDRLLDFDFDDRGNVYLAYDEFGWGIVKDSGETNASHLPKVVQVTVEPNAIEPRLIISIKSGGKYYAIVSNPSNPIVTSIYDVTSPATPALVSTMGPLDLSKGIVQWAKDDNAGVVAVLNGDGKLRIYTYDNIVSSRPVPIETLTAPSGKLLKSPTFDETGNLWVLTTSKDPVVGQTILKLVPSGGGYTTQTISPYPVAFAPAFMHVAAGYVAVGGTIRQNGDRTNELMLFKIEGSNLRFLDVDGFFRKYYHSAPSGFAQPGAFANFPTAVQIVREGTKTYLMYQSFGLGDVFQLGDDGPSLSATMKTSSFGTVNPNARPTQTGPFPGDVVTFNATLVPSGSGSLTWNFGNTEAGTTGTNANIVSGSTGVDVTHQFTGLNNASKVTTPRNVSATVTTDSNLTDAFAVTLKLPEPRIALKATGEVITASGFEAVVGDTFVDASDGSVESHVAVWQIGATSTSLRPDQEIPVGALGQHAVQFAGHYGKYDPNTLAAPAQAYVASLASRSYEVKPFIAKLKPVTRAGSTVTYGATARVTSDHTALSASQWTVTWTIKSGQVETANQTNLVAVGSVPNFSFDKSLLANGSIVKLAITVDPSTVPAPSLASYEISSVVTLPDPVIQLTNCANVGDTCSIKAISGTGSPTSGWALSWVVKRGTDQVASGTGNPLASFKLTTEGQYSVSVTETVFDTPPVSLGFVVEKSACGPPPNIAQMSISPSCTTCTSNTVVSFRAVGFGYVIQECDVITWTFGDGGTATGAEVTHTYTSDGSFNVTMKIKNTTDTVGTTFTKAITVGTPQTPCTLPSNINFTYTGPNTCGAGGTCKTGETLRFTGHRGTGSLASCDSAQWSFGDASTSTSKSPSHTYTTAGTYTVTLVVSNSSGQSTSSQSITIAPGATTGCGPAPTEANVSMRYTGKQSGCTKSNNLPCKAGEQVDFEVNFFQYQLQSCDKFEWTFGDGTAVVTTQNPSHTFPADRATSAVSVRIFNATNSTGVTLSANLSFGEIAPAKEIPTITLPSFPTTGAKNTPVTFTAASNISATGWSWDFGDGTKDSTSQASVVGTSTSIQHTYTKTGTFSVSVKARNSADVPTAQSGTAVSITGIVITDIPEYKFMLPVVTHGPGQNNSVWRTDVQIYTSEPGVSPATPLKMTATLRDITRNLEVFNSTFTYEDFMRVFTTANDSGPVIITVRSQTAPQIWTRTYNQTDTGTFGQFIPAIRIDAAAGGGSAFGTGKYYMAGLRHDARYRTNLGFVNPNAQAVNATVRVYDDTRLLIGQFALHLDPYQLDQFPITADKAVKNLPAGRPFSLQIEVPPGLWLIGYASFIDSASNDPVYVQAVRESELGLTDFNSIVIPGVGHVGEWRSDVTIFNPDSDSVMVDLAYHDQSGAKVGEAKGIQIRSGEFLQYTDLIKQGVFGSLSDSLGVLRVSLSGPFPPATYPLTFARTYNDKGTGKTFGQGIGGFAAARANVKPGKPALVPGIRSNAKYYTNVGLTNVSAVPVRAFVKLLDPTTGAEQLIQTTDLQPNQSVVGRVDLGNLETASLKVEVTGGNCWAFASIVDKGTADPEYVAATPLQ